MGYQALMDTETPDKVWLYPNELEFCRSAQSHVHWEDKTSKTEIQSGTLILTTHRVLFQKMSGAAELPLCYIDKVTYSGGMGFLSWLCVSITTKQSIGQPCYVKDYFTNVKKIDNPVDLPNINKNKVPGEGHQE